jgi:hypothetical protein
MNRPRCESWRARAHEREGLFQAQTVGVTTLREDWVVAYKTQTH